MKRFISAAAVMAGCLCCGSVSAQEVQDGFPVRNLDSLLCSIRTDDQRLRVEIMEALGKGDVERVVALNMQIDAQDRVNQETVFSILDSCGIPDHLSDSAYSAVFLVVDHAELAAQKKYFPLIEEAAESGKMSASDAATLQDRILMREGKRQIYGTQNIVVGNGNQPTAYVWPVEDPENLDCRRSSVGLDGIQDWIPEFKAASGMDLVYDKNLTVKKIRKLQKRNPMIMEDK